MCKKFFKFDEAVRYMLKGFKVKHKNWQSSDYIYIVDGKIYCDGGYEYSNHINNRLLLSKNWQVSSFTNKDIRKIRI